MSSTAAYRSARLLSSVGCRSSARAFASSTRGTTLRSLSAGMLQQQQRSGVRAFASEARGKVAKTLQAESTHENEQYEQPKEIKAFLKQSEFKFIDEEGDVNMMLEKKIGNRVARIEWQLASPYAPDADMEGGEDDGSQEATDFVITVEDESGGSGLSFYCSTQAGEDHRYVIGAVKQYSSADEKESVSSYNGPDFEDIDDKLQEAFDEYIAEVGMNNEVCDFIDAMALDKEQREYIRWLKLTQKFMTE